MKARTILSVFVGLAAFTALIRLPFWPVAVIDWDESTFTLVGQSILDGQLPYVHLWDVKPPLLFAFFAAAIALFGHTIEGIRIAGSLCVAVTAAMTWAIASDLWNRAAGWLAALLCVLGSTLLGSGQATMSEHVMLPAFMGAVYLLLNRPLTPRTSFWIGVLVAVASLVRLNMAYAAVAVGILVIAGSKARVRVREGLAYAAGGLLVLGLTCLPFAAAGELPRLWKSAVVAALARAEVEGMVARVSSLYDRAFQAGGDGSGSTTLLWIGLLLWPGAIAGLLIAWRAPTATAGRQAMTAVAALLTATAVSIVMSGGAFGHYLIQLVPLASVACGVLAVHPTQSIRRAIWSAVMMLGALSLVPVAEQYRLLATRHSAGLSLRHGEGYEIADYLNRENAGRRPILMFSDHIAYWLSRSEPPSGYATHPSTLGRPNVLRVMGTSPQDELRRIFGRHPVFVVIDRREQFLQDEERTWVDEVLHRDYVAEPEIAGREIWRRRD